MSVIVYGMLAMTGRVTMLGIARWAGKGGSYRTVQRFFQTGIPWKQVMWVFFCTHLHRTTDEVVLAGDECIVTKAGKVTHGLDRFFASIYGRPVSALAFFALSVVNVRERRAYPVMAEQIIRSREEKTAVSSKESRKQARKTDVRAKGGRPKGSRTQSKTVVTLTPELQRIQAMLRQFLDLAGATLNLAYLVLDGHFGNNNALQMVRQCGLHLVSKLRTDSELYSPYEGQNKRQKYGQRVDFTHLPDGYLCQTTINNNIRTDIYQAVLLHKAFAQPLNVVVLLKSHLQTGAGAHVILFASDLNLSWQKVIDFYQLRFQIEFNFRDAKQYWGLDDFMVVRETPVTNAINLSLFMVNVTSVLLQSWRAEDSAASVLDLKAYYRAHKYVNEILKLLPQKPNPVLGQSICRRVSRLGMVHSPTPSLFSV
mgnify:CR=1 FL=1